ncbi:MAG: DEAD/DEAH box helicase, partial [Bacteroidota bacterium]
FVDDIETLLQATPSTRQTAFLSATLPKAIRQLCTRYQQDPVVCEMKHVQATADQIEHRHHLVHQHDKIAALTRLFEAEPIESALVFAHTRDRTDAVALALTERGYPAESLHGGMSQQARERVLRRFRDGQLSVLVGTDVAARGLDIDDITHVFNHDLPRDPEVYVHRVGRTGRAGRTGTAISLVAPHDKSRLRRIERFIKQSIPGRPLPTAEDLEARRTQALVDRVGVWLRRGRCTAERALIDGLVAEGHDVAAVAAAALKVAREATEPKQPVAPVQPVEARPARGGGKRPPARRASAPGRPDRRDRNHRDRDHDMVTLKLNTGHAHGIHPKHIVRSLAENGGIPGRVIGRIDIQQHHTHVDVPASYVDRVLAQPKPYPMNARQVTVDRA